MLALLVDENLNHRILRGLLRSVPHLDYLLALDAGLKGANDPAVLEVAARETSGVVVQFGLFAWHVLVMLNCRPDLARPYCARIR